MIALAIVLAYVLAGMVSGRVAFIRTLGESPRYRFEKEYANLHVANDFTKVDVRKQTKELQSAKWHAGLTAAFWPVALPFLLIVSAPTPHEKAVAKEAKQKELEARFKELEADVMAFGKVIR